MLFIYIYICANSDSSNTYSNYVYFGALLFEHSNDVAFKKMSYFLPFIVPSSSSWRATYESDGNVKLRHLSNELQGLHA